MAYPLPAKLLEQLRTLHTKAGHWVILTGAGISAESGIPTFRGAEGYWVVGSKTYQPQEMATFAMFMKDPEAVWAWYLYRRGVCHAAAPNPGHAAVTELEGMLGERFRLITQNVDGLHLRAGSSPARTYRIHGDLDYARCAVGCGLPPWRLPDTLILPQTGGTTLPDGIGERLRCPHCGGWARPHVLWFDEYYDEQHYCYESSIRAAVAADTLLVVGTSGATNLPMQVGRLAAKAGAMMIDINIEPNPFSRLAESQGGFFLQGSSATILPVIVRQLQLLNGA